MFDDLVAENAIMLPPFHECNLHIFMEQDCGSFSEPLIQNFKTVYVRPYCWPEGVSLLQNP